VSSGAGAGKASASTAPRIPALPTRNENVVGRCPIPQRFRSAFTRAAHDTGFQLSMLVAVAQVESRFQPNARSHADARGLLQVLPATAAELRLDVDRPASNVLAGARYLKQLLDRYRRTDLALAAYNAGPTAVDRVGGAPYSETQTYIANVQQRWAALAGCA
jgi:soluble lytic murein transglycosylase-like protein